MIDVSVLIPSRGRPRKLALAIESILATAAVPDDIEILVRVDSDDTETILNFPGNADAIIGPRYRGYLDADRYWNELAAEAKGRWLVAFNDDALMRAPGWDLLLSKIPDLYAVVFPTDNYNRSSFPIVTRSIYSLWGHITVFPGIDTWIKEVTLAADKVVPIYATEVIAIEHQRPNLPGYESFNDKTWEESDVAEQQLCKDWDLKREHWKTHAEQDRAALRALRLV